MSQHDLALTRGGLVRQPSHENVLGGLMSHQLAAEGRHRRRVGAHGDLRTQSPAVVFLQDCEADRGVRAGNLLLGAQWRIWQRINEVTLNKLTVPWCALQRLREMTSWGPKRATPK